jgi:hypothetical protein
LDHLFGTMPPQLRRLCSLQMATGMLLDGIHARTTMDVRVVVDYLDIGDVDGLVEGRMMSSPVTVAMTVTVTVAMIVMPVMDWPAEIPELNEHKRPRVPANPVPYDQTAGPTITVRRQRRPAVVSAPFTPSHP